MKDIKDWFEISIHYVHVMDCMIFWIFVKRKFEKYLL